MGRAFLGEGGEKEEDSELLFPSRPPTWLAFWAEGLSVPVWREREAWETGRWVLLRCCRYVGSSRCDQEELLCNLAFPLLRADEKKIEILLLLPLLFIRRGRERQLKPSRQEEALCRERHSWVRGKQATVTRCYQDNFFFKKTVGSAAHYAQTF